VDLKRDALAIGKLRHQEIVERTVLDQTSFDLSSANRADQIVVLGEDSDLDRRIASFRSGSSPVGIR